MSENEGRKHPFRRWLESMGGRNPLLDDIPYLKSERPSYRYPEKTNRHAPAFGFDLNHDGISTHVEGVWIDGVFHITDTYQIKDGMVLREDDGSASGEG